MTCTVTVIAALITGLVLGVFGGWLLRGWLDGDADLQNMRSQAEHRDEIEQRNREKS